MIFCTPWPGISAAESRGIESLRTLPNAECMTMIVSARPGAWLSSSDEPLRWSEPSTSVVAPVKKLPPSESAASASSETPSWSWALTTNRTTDSASQPSTASDDPLEHPPGREAARRARVARVARALVVLALAWPLECAQALEAAATAEEPAAA